MAAISSTELYGNHGKVWERVIALFELYLLDVTLTWTSATIGVVSGSRAVTVVITGAVDTNTYILIDINTSTNQTHSLAGFFAVDNINKSLRMFQPTYLGRTLATEFTGKLVVAKRAMVAAWCAATTYTTTAYTLSATVGLAIVTTLSVNVYNVRFSSYVDAMTFTSRTVVAGILTPGEVDMGAGQKASGVTSYGGGLTQEQLTGITDLLSDISLVDMEYSMNNGAALFSIRGKSRRT